MMVILMSVPRPFHCSSLRVCVLICGICSILIWFSSLLLLVPQEGIVLQEEIEKFKNTVARFVTSN